MRDAAVRTMICGLPRPALPGDPLGERILQISQLLEEASVGPDRPGLPDSLQSLKIIGIQ